jgi:hypothetical protein
MKYIVEIRSRDRKWSDWEELCEERLERDEVLEFFKDCDDGINVQYRARLLPQFGYEVLTPCKTFVDEPDQRLSREMPASVHRLNDQILSALGV